MNFEWIHDIASLWRKSSQELPKTKMPPPPAPEPKPHDKGYQVITQRNGDKLVIQWGESKNLLYPSAILPPMIIDRPTYFAITDVTVDKQHIITDAKQLRRPEAPKEMVGHHVRWVLTGYVYPNDERGDRLRRLARFDMAGKFGMPADYANNATQIKPKTIHSLRSNAREGLHQVARDKLREFGTDLFKGYQWEHIADDRTRPLHEMIEEQSRNAIVKALKDNPQITNLHVKDGKIFGSVAIRRDALLAQPLPPKLVRRVTVGDYCSPWKATMGINGKNFVFLGETAEEAWQRAYDYAVNYCAFNDVPAPWPRWMAENWRIK